MIAMESPSASRACKVDRALFGCLGDGTEIERITLSNGKGISASIITYGATLQAVMMPDWAGRVVDITLGHDQLEPYVERPRYFGVTVGRYANRIAGGRLVIDNRTYPLAVNDGANTLHGGGRGFDTQVWTVASVETGDVASVGLTLHSPDGDAGFPGALDARVTYTLSEQGDLSILFEAKTDKPTVVNMTNHAIFNLAGEGAPQGTSDHVLMIAAGWFTPVDANLIPTGFLKSVDKTVFDFRRPCQVAKGIRNGQDAQIRFGRGYDHNFVLDEGLTEFPKLAARLEDPASGRVLEVLTTEPGIQLYTGNRLDGTLPGKQGHLYRAGDGIALEPQKFPDSPNQSGFPSARLDPNKPYRHLMIYRLSVKP